MKINRMWIRVLFVLPALCLFVERPSLALPVQPPGLQPGQAYHWMFVTRGTRDAESTNINDYNNFVRSQAALNPSLTGTNEGVLWYAIASTETVDAKDNAHVSGPVYLLDGTMFSPDSANMWAPPTGTNILGTHATRPNIDQFGVERSLDEGPWVWTGTVLDGTADGFHFLGGSVGSEVWVGRYDTPLGEWILWGHFWPGSQQPLYALSSALKAEAVPEVPEPGSFLLLATGASCLVAVRLRNKRRGLSRASAAVRTATKRRGGERGRVRYFVDPGSPCAPIGEIR